MCWNEKIRVRSCKTDTETDINTHTHTHTHTHTYTHAQHTHTQTQKNARQIDLQVYLRCACVEMVIARELSLRVWKESSLTIIIRGACVERELSLRVCKETSPHRKLLGDGLSTPITPFGLICTISSEPSFILDLYQYSPRP